MSTRRFVVVIGALALASCAASRAPKEVVPVAATTLPASGLDAAVDAPPARLPRPADPSPTSRFDVDASVIRPFGAFAITHDEYGMQQTFDLPTAFITCVNASAVYVRFEREHADGGGALRPVEREGSPSAVDCVLKRLEKHASPWRGFEEVVRATEIYVVPPASR